MAISKITHPTKTYPIKYEFVCSKCKAYHYATIDSKSCYEIGQKGGDNNCGCNLDLEITGQGIIGVSRSKNLKLLGKAGKVLYG